MDEIQDPWVILNSQYPGVVETIQRQYVLALDTAGLIEVNAPQPTLSVMAVPELLLYQAWQVTQKNFFDGNQYVEWAEKGWVDYSNQRASSYDPHHNLIQQYGEYGPYGGTWTIEQLLVESPLVEVAYMALMRSYTWYMPRIRLNDAFGLPTARTLEVAILLEPELGWKWMIDIADSRRRQRNEALFDDFTHHAYMRYG